MMSNMRTTLTLDKDVALLLKQEMRQSDSSMKTVINDALRIGLGAAAKPAHTNRFAVKPHAFGFKTGLDTDKIGQLADELEDEKIVGKLDL